MTLCLCPSGVQKQRNKGISYNYMTTKTFKGLSGWSSMPEAMFAKWPLVKSWQSLSRLTNKVQNVSYFEQPKRNRGKQLHSRFVLSICSVYLFTANSAWFEQKFNDLRHLRNHVLGIFIQNFREPKLYWQTLRQTKYKLFCEKKMNADSSFLPSILKWLQMRV